MHKLAVLIVLAICPAFGESAEKMLSSCKVFDEAKVESEGSEMTVSFAHDFDSGVCWGAFAVLQMASRFVDPKREPIRPLLPIGCVPERVSRTQSIAIFVHYARQHPERLHEDFVFVAMDALKTAFPCRAAE